MILLFTVYLQLETVHFDAIMSITRFFKDFILHGKFVCCFSVTRAVKVGYENIGGITNNLKLGLE